jgi:HD-like signal output (HDOD) protein
MKGMALPNETIMDYQPKEGQSNQKAHDTMEFLMHQIQQKGDFPTFSRHIMEINRKATASSSNPASASDLANVVLKSYSLTNKLLRLVNSAFYGHHAGSITTISRAVVVLGFERVRMAASSLMLFEHLKNRSQSHELQDASISAFMSGMIAKELSEKLEYIDTEEAFICSMLNQLGRYLALLYFPEECEQVKELITREGFSEYKAARSVLGLPFEEIGSSVATSWGFPQKIVSSMQTLPEGKLGKPRSELDMLRTLSGFSNELCNLTATARDRVRERGLPELLNRFEKSIHLSKRQVSKLLNDVKSKVEEHAEILGINTKESRFLSRIEHYRVPEAETPSEKSPGDEKDRFNDTWTLDAKDFEIRHGDTLFTPSQDPEALLISGIQDIAYTLVGEYQLNDVLTMIMETVFRGFALNRVVFCSVEPNKKTMRARLGFGKKIDVVMSLFRFDFEKPGDVFGLAVSRGKDVSIHDVNDEKIRKRLPDWYLKVVSSQAFMLFPIIIDRKPFALLYMDRKEMGPVIKDRHINYVKTFRNQAILAIKQKL